MQEFEEIGLEDDLIPLVGRNPNHRAEQLKHQVGILAALLDHKRVVFQMLDEVVVCRRIELCDVADTLEEQCVAVLRGTGNQLVQLALAGEHVRVALISRQVDG